MRTKMLAGVLAGCALLAAGCGDDDDSSGDAASSASTVAVGAAPTPGSTGAGDVAEGTPAPTVAGDVPTRIVSLSPTSTETLFAIGAGGQVVAVDDFSNYPPEAAALPNDLSGYEPNLEAIAGYEPDLVVSDGTNPDLIAGLESLGITHWEGPAAATVGDVYTQIEQLGVVTGHVGEAAELVASMEAGIAEIQAGIPELAEPLTYYHELDSSYFSVTSDTFIGSIYSMVGLQNIADAAETDAGPYPQLNAEFIIAADPDLVFLACTKYCGETAESVAARPGWGAMTAVANGGVIEMDDDIASRWGPRVVDYLRAVADAVAGVASAQPAG
jgi:iron complex transport system substrate-binding protein